MNTKLRHLIFSSAALICACDSSDDEILEVHDSAEPSPSAASELSSESEATPYSLVECPGTRIMVGILDLENYPDALCDPIEQGAYMPPGWTWDTMFATGHEQLQLAPSELPGELRKFCMFTFVEPYVPQAEDYAELFSALSNWNEIAEYGPDCMGMAAAGELNGGTVREALRTAMLDNIHLPSTSPTCSGLDCTKVVVLDTEVGDFVTPGTYLSDHGGLVAGIIAAIQGSGWSGEISYENAFPGSDGESSILHWDAGGDAGSMATLALALFKASWEFRADMPNVATSDLPVRSAVNISLGFLRDLSPGYETSPPAQALHTALQYVSCGGQLVIAAAGNNTDERCPGNQTGALAPAIYETEVAPSDDDCVDLGFEVPAVYGQEYRREPVETATYNPLVFAVGGVDGQDRPLPNTRKGGQPRLVAYASGSVGVDFQFDPARVALTGTSAAAAAVTGVASTLWGLAPELSGAEIMEIIYNAGYATGDLSDFQLGSPQAIHRLSYCAALASLCVGRDPSMCPMPTCGAQAPAVDSYLGDYATAAQVAVNSSTVYYASVGVAQSPVCEDHDLSQLLLKNPEDPICPHCNITKGAPPVANDDQVQMDIISDYKGLIVGASLSVSRSDGTRAQYTFDSSTVSALNDPAIGITIVAIDEPIAVEATLHFLVDDPAAGVVNQDNGAVIYDGST